MSDLSLMLRLQSCVMAFLADLSRDRLVALVEGRARLTIAEQDDGRESAPADPVPALPSTASVPRSRRSTTGAQRSAATELDADKVVAQLRACETFAEGSELLAALKLTAVQTKLVAKTLNIPAARTKDETAKRILTLTLANRNKHSVLRQG